MTLEGGNIEEFKRELERSDVIRMGAFKSKGFGNCKLRYVRTVEKPVIKAGRLQTRIPVKHLSLFGISEIKPVYGYLFEPETPVSGKYVKSLYEGSLVKGYDFLIEEEQ